MTTPTLDKLYIELSLITTAKSPREVQMEKLIEQSYIVLEAVQQDSRVAKKLVAKCMDTLYKFMYGEPK